MSDFNGATALVRRFLLARVPLIIINTIEPSRAIELLSHLARELNSMPFFEYSRTEGLREVTTRQLVVEDKSLPAALEQAQVTIKSRANVNFIFTDAVGLEADGPEARTFAQMARLAEQHRGTLILIVDGPVWTGLSRLGMSETLDLPTTEELVHILSGMVDDNRAALPIEWGWSEVRQAAEILTGVTKMEALNVVASVMAKGQVLNTDLVELAAFKDKIFGDLSGIERIVLREDYQVGGLARLKAWLREREAFMKADLSQATIHPPRGILLCGVPGCGKSLSAKAIPQEWNLPLYRLDMATVLGMYVGQSENQLREALQAAERVAPCVLWVDEIEKGLASSSTDNSVTKRLIGQFLFWLQESTAKVFMVATANDVQSLPPELLRKGRFDEVFFVDLPNDSDREEIIRVCFAKYTGLTVPADLLAELTRITEGYSGSDIDAAVHEIEVRRFRDGLPGLPDHGFICDVFSRTLPYSATNPDDIAFIRAWGRERAMPASD